MPRPRKCRRVCSMPVIEEFVPVFRRTSACRLVKEGLEKDPVILTIDEYETIRLIDREKMSQEECGTYMQVARTTVQQIYESARTKVAESLVSGRMLRIEGGDYKICSGDGTGCRCERCRKMKGECKGAGHEDNRTD